MKYSELFTKGNGIFATVFKTEYPTEYAAIFGDTAPEKLDAYALLMYGGKTVVSSITSDNASDVVSAVIAVNVQGWEREAAAMLADYDVLTPVTGEIERMETVTLQESTDNTETGANKAFNDTDFQTATERPQTMRETAQKAAKRPKPAKERAQVNQFQVKLKKNCSCGEIIGEKTLSLHL